MTLTKGTVAYRREGQAVPHRTAHRGAVARRLRRAATGWSSRSDCTAATLGSPAPSCASPGSDVHRQALWRPLAILEGRRLFQRRRGVVDSRVAPHPAPALPLPRRGHDLRRVWSTGAGTPPDLCRAARRRGAAGGSVTWACVGLQTSHDTVCYRARLNRDCSTGRLGGMRAAAARGTRNRGNVGPCLGPNRLFRCSLRPARSVVSLGRRDVLDQRLLR